MADEYRIREICGDWALDIPRPDLTGVLIFNSRVNAELVKAILVHEDAHPNQAVPFHLTPADEPLTLEQLQKMNGQPVWVTSARERGNIPSRWVLFAGVSKSKRNSDVFVFATTGGIAQGYEAVNYGKTWNAYRRPPERQEDT